MKRDYLTFKLQDVDILKEHLGTATEVVIPMIYSLRCLVNDRRYIGYSQNRVYVISKKIRVSRFISHYEQLEAGRHINQLLQEDWNTHGKDSFKFEVLEIFPKAPDSLFHISLVELLDKEFHWHEQFVNTYSNPSQRKVEVVIREGGKQ